MIVEINTSNKKKMDWNVKGNERVVQNVCNLLNIFKYEVAYNRIMGLTGKWIDKPLDQAIAEATTEIIELITIYEPRAEVIEVDFMSIDDEGNMQFKVVIDI